MNECKEVFVAYCDFQAKRMMRQRTVVVPACFYLSLLCGCDERGVSLDGVTAHAEQDAVNTLVKLTHHR